MQNSLLSLMFPLQKLNQLENSDNNPLENHNCDRFSKTMILFSENTMY